MPAMARHIGIVGCSAEGAALCYRTFCVEAAELMGPHDHPEVSMHTHSLARYIPAMEAGDWQVVGELMLDSARKLAAVGAELLICPDNTIHQAMEFVEPAGPLPWLHIAREVVAVAKADGRTTLGILGTRFLMTGPVYADAASAAGLTAVIPDEPDRAEIDPVIFEELTCGQCLPESRAFFNDVMARLKARGCDAAVLGCTEIPLLVDPATAPLPTLDSTRLLARAALREALAGR